MEKAAAKQGICVAIRMRPLNEREQSGGQEKIFSCSTQTNAIVHTKDAMAVETSYYDKVFDETAANKEVYAQIAQGIVEGVVKGINGTIFAC